MIMQKKATIRAQVERVLKGRKKGLTPTEIGLKLGYDKLKASGTVSPVLKRLVAENLVIRSENGRRVEYRSNDFP